MTDTEGLMSETLTTASGVPVAHMWAIDAPIAGKPDLGFPAMPGTRHTVIFEPTRETGGYNHHPQIAHHEQRFFAMWSNHPRGEDGPGQRVLWSRSANGDEWSDARELFPPPGDVRDSDLTGLVLTAVKWVALGERLFAVVGLHENIGFTTASGEGLQETRGGEFRTRARKGFSRLAREVFPDGSFGRVMAIGAEVPERLAFPVRTDATTADEVHRRLLDPTHSPSWDFQRRWAFPDGVSGNKLCEPTAYRAKDGRLVCLQRDKERSHRMYVSVSADDGATWPPAQPTDIPDSPSLATTVVLGDGRVLLIGNQVATELDNPDGERHYFRDPLTLAVSDDGYVFDRAYALCANHYVPRIDGVRGRGGGPQYPAAIVVEGELHVIYSLGKENVGVTRVSLDQLATTR